jgi:hypothetical protein
LLLLGPAVPAASGASDGLVGHVRVGGGPRKDVVIWLLGVPGTRTTSGYADLVVHRPGARIRVWRTVAGSRGVVHQAGQLTQRERTAFDFGVTGSWRRDF